MSFKPLSCKTPPLILPQYQPPHSSNRITLSRPRTPSLTHTRFSWDTVLPLFVKQTFHWDATAAGLVFFALFIPGIISPAVGALSDRHGARYPSLAGFALSIPLLVSLRFVTSNTLPHKALLAALLALVGVTLTLSNTPLMAEISYATAAAERSAPRGVFGVNGAYGLGYGLFCTSFALGGSVGALMSGFVVSARGWATMTWVLAVWMAGGAVVVGLFAGAPAEGKGKEGALDPRRDGREDVEGSSEVTPKSGDAVGAAVA